MIGINFDNFPKKNIIDMLANFIFLIMLISLFLTIIKFWINGKIISTICYLLVLTIITIPIGDYVIGKLDI